MDRSLLKEYNKFKEKSLEILAVNLKKQSRKQKKPVQYSDDESLTNVKIPVKNVTDDEQVVCSNDEKENMSLKNKSKNKKNNSASKQVLMSSDDEYNQNARTQNKKLALKQQKAVQDESLIQKYKLTPNFVVSDVSSTSSESSDSGAPYKTKDMKMARSKGAKIHTKLLQKETNKKDNDSDSDGLIIDLKPSRKNMSPKSNSAVKNNSSDTENISASKKKLKRKKKKIIKKKVKKDNEDCEDSDSDVLSISSNGKKSSIINSPKKQTETNPSISLLKESENKMNASIISEKIVEKQKSDLSENSDAKTAYTEISKVENSDNEIDHGIKSTDKNQNGNRVESSDDSDDDVSTIKKRKGIKIFKSNKSFADSDDSSGTEDLNTDSKKSSKENDVVGDDFEGATDPLSGLVTNNLPNGGMKDEGRVFKKRKAVFKDSSSDVSESECEVNNTKETVCSDIASVRPKSDRNQTRKEKMLELIAKMKVKKGIEETCETKDNNNLFQDKDLFSQESSSDENEEDEIMKADSNDNLLDDEDEMKQKLKIKRKKKPAQPKIKRPTKDDIKNTKSEQQRLCREQTFKLPVHIPTPKPLKDFLQRVPKLTPKNNAKKKSDETKVNKDCKPTSLHSLFKQKPKLQHLDAEETIEFEEEDDQQPVKSSGLDNFMKRFAKHAGTPGSKHKPDVFREVIEVNDATEVENKNVVDMEVIETVLMSQIPGGRHNVLKKQLKEKMRKDRHRNHVEMEKQMKLYNEELCTDEEETDDDGGESLSSDDENEENETKENAESEDEEIKKWNADEERVQLEESMTKEAKDEHKVVISNEKNECSNDLFPGPSERTCATASHVNDLEREDHFRGWDDSSSTMSSVLPAGQGDPTDRKISNDGRLTPFTKLLKSSLLDSASRTSNTNDLMRLNEGSTLILPCENTQDLYREDERVVLQTIDNEDTQITSQGFHFSLDGDTEYDHILDSQGFLQDNKKTKKLTAKKLFDAETQDLNKEVGMTQVLGLCSGTFKSDSPKATTVFGLPVDTESQSEDLLNLCTGNFTTQKENLFKPNELELQTDSSFNTQNMNITDLCSGKFTTQVETTKIEDGPSFKGLFDSSAKACNGTVDEVALEFCSGNFSTQTRNEVNSLTCVKDKNIGINDDSAIDFSTGSFMMQSKLNSNEAINNSEKDVLENSNDCNNQTEVSKTDKDNTIKDSVVNKKCKNEFGFEESDDDCDGDYNKKIDEGDKENDIVENGVLNDDGNVDNDEDDVDNDEDNVDNVDDGVDNIESENNDDAEVDNADDEIDDANADTDFNESDNEEMLKWKESLTGGKRLNKKAFYEKEAELSGSDVGTDDEELGSEFDEYEVDSDVENGLPTGEKLKRQVHRIHQRKMIDQDKQELRLLQELYLEDGDLGEGTKRQRNFKWRNIDNMSFEDDNQGKTSDGEEDHHHFDMDMTKNMERIEREKFLQESQDNEGFTLDENSQSILNMIQDSTTFTPPATTLLRIGEKKLTSSQPKSCSVKRSGSFLCRSKSALSRLSASDVIKCVTKSTKGFVFQSTEERPVAKDNKKTRRSTSLQEPPAKRIKVDQNVKLVNNSKSIFHHL